MIRRTLGAVLVGEEGRALRVLINAQIGGPLSGAKRKTFAHSEPFRF